MSDRRAPSGTSVLTSDCTSAGVEFVGAVVDRGGVIDLAGLLPAGGSGQSPIRGLIHHRDAYLNTLQDALDGPPILSVGDIELPPIVPDPTKIVAAPVNYFDHKAEMNEDAHIDALRVFLKAPSSRPYLVNPDEVGDVDGLRLRTWVNGDLLQNADLSEPIWGFPELLSYVSSVMTLHPGDILATGTPAGIGQVVDGDEIAVEISQLGQLRVAVTAESAAVCPKGANRGPKLPASVTLVRQR